MYKEKSKHQATSNLHVSFIMIGLFWFYLPITDELGFTVVIMNTMCQLLHNKLQHVPGTNGKCTLPLQ